MGGRLPVKIDAEFALLEVEHRDATYAAKMFGAVGAPIRRLVRVRIGGVRLGTLRSGTTRPVGADVVTRPARTPTTRRHTARKRSVR